MPSHDLPDLSQLKTYAYHDRKHLVRTDMFVEPIDPPGDFLAGIPSILAGRKLRLLCSAVAKAKVTGKQVVFAMGAHVIKCGLSRLVIDLMERGIVTAVAFNGACAIHDWEIAFGGATSEDVAENLPRGDFGMCRETAEALNLAAACAAREKLGFGEVLGREMEQAKLPFLSHSILAAGYRLKVPVTVHVSLGCDIVHMHENAEGSAIGAATLTDFRRLAGITACLEEGVWLNVGSSVLLPEVFLKTLSMARNLKGEPHRFVTADLDMIRHYRPQQNVLSRPGEQGLGLTGHHEIMIPLLRWGILNELERDLEGDQA